MYLYIDGMIESGSDDSAAAVVAAADAGGSAPGRPRSEAARRAVLHAVDDLLVEVGYAAMTMKGIAERAGVGRQTVYRWWSNKAEILVEACVHDARHELASAPVPDPAEDLVGYLAALTRFLTRSPAGLAYRALVGEAQHDPYVRELVRQADLLTEPTRRVLARVGDATPGQPAPELAQAQLTGPVLGHLLTTGSALPDASLKAHVDLVLRSWRS